MYKYSRGVTLVELMVVLVIVAVLMSVAVPSYRQYTMRANRAEGHWSLLQAAANQERFYLQNNTYATNAQLELDPPNGLGVASMTESGHYSIQVTNADAAGYTVVATAQGGQTEDSDCSVLSVDERGTRYGGPGPAGGANNDPKCW